MSIFCVLSTYCVALPICYVILSICSVACGFVLSISGISSNIDWTLEWTLDLEKKNTGCPVPIFSYFFTIFLFSPIFKLKPPIFPIF